MLRKNSRPAWGELRPQDEVPRVKKTPAKQPSIVISKILRKFASILHQCFVQFCTTTSLHSCKFMVSPVLLLIERLFWVVAILLSLTAASFFIWQLFYKYGHTPVYMALSSSPIDVTTIPFPAITICNMNNIRKSKAIPLLNETVDNEPSWNRRLINRLCDQEIRAIDKSIPKRTSFKRFVEFTRNVTQPCSDMITYCRWSGTTINCEDWFQPVITDEGHCCTFNRVNWNSIFRNSTNYSEPNYTEPIQANWDPVTGYPPDAPLNSVPWRSTGSGSTLGLTIGLDAEIDEYYCSTESSIGFKVMLHVPIETVNVAAFGAVLSPGQEARYAIEPRIMTAVSGLGKIDVSKRQCVLQEERSLKYYNMYTEQNCNMECEANYSITFCDCTYEHMPRFPGQKICEGDENRCADDALKKIDAVNIFGKSTNENLLCDCLPACYDISYGGKISSTPLTKLIDIDHEYLGKTGNISYFRRNGAIVTFYYTKTQFTAIERRILYGFTEFLSNIGGLLGLFMGFTLISVVEIIYYLTVKVIILAKHSTQTTTQEIRRQIFNIKPLPWVQ